MDVVGSGSIWMKHTKVGDVTTDKLEPGQAAQVKMLGTVEADGSVFEDTGDQPRTIRIGDCDVPSGVCDVAIMTSRARESDVGRT